MSLREYRSRTALMQKIASEEWANEHGLYHSILPYGYRKQNPIDILTAFQQTFASLGKYSQSYWLDDVKKHSGYRINPNQRDRLLHWSGSWAWTGWDTTSSHRYCNPRYVHNEYQPIEDTDRREWLIRQTNGMPQWGPTKLGHAFGVTSRHAQRLRNNVLDSYDRQKNRERFTRTIKTINHWGVKWKDIAFAFGYTTDTLRKRFRKEYAQDFTPPENPLG